ncbi:hypothetical protein ACFFK0_17305 [Paenibacillus chartarius]|uniref:Fibronectin type-III domain-containing protein n=1 Tax=Paenibacillus chartarius TaxID=747481 RepID=A0ABV6DNG7_9BACL
MASLSRLESEYRKQKRRRKMRRPWLIACAVLFAAAGTAAIIERDQLGWNHREASGVRAAAENSNTTEPVSTPSPAVTPVSKRPLTAGKLTLWTPQKVDADTIPVMFSFESASAQSLRVTLQVKKQGETDFRTATLKSGGELAVQAGKRMYSVAWDKAKDGVEAGSTFEIRLSVSSDGAEPLVQAIRNVKLQSREQVRNQVDRYVVNYGTWSNEQLEEARTHAQLAIVTAKNMTTEQIQTLRAGKDPADAADDVIVLGYISVGEDQRTDGFKDNIEAMKNDPRFTLDGSGPSVDPRPGAPYPNGGELAGSYSAAGKPTNKGFAPFYLNDNFVTDRVGAEGVPEFNPGFGSAFVNPGHPEWLKALEDMTFASDKVSGLKELLTPNFGAGFACDGLFLDTLDTAAPNSYTDASSYNVTEYEWTAKGTKELLQNIRQRYPDKLLLGNRGLFYYNADLPAFAYTLRGAVDFVLFESFRLDSRTDEWFNESFFNDNKYNYAQKLLAEADRSDGFRVLSLGYAEGPDGGAAKQALTDASGAAAPATLLEDVKETEQLGMVHYLTDAGLTIVNHFAAGHRLEPAAPTWGSTKTPSLYGKPYDGPREGIQQVAVRGKDVFVQWDVAHSSARPISYVLYAKEGTDFDKAKPIEEQGAKVIELSKDIPAAYAGAGDRTKRYPYESKVQGLEPGKSYYLVIRARNAVGQYEGNWKSLYVTVPK